MKSSIVCGIDVGNYAIKTIIAETNSETLQPRIIGVGVAPSNGLRRGMVVDMEEASASVRDSVERAQAMAGVKVTSAFVSVNGLHVKTQTSRGVIAVSRPDNEITQSDVTRLVDSASTVSLPMNYEMIHVIPKSFTIDGREHVKNPLGMKGVRLEVEVLLVEGLSPYLRNLAKCITLNGVEVAEFVFAPLAAAKAVLDKHQLEYGVLLVDMGGGVSSMAMFHEGELVHTAALPIGSRHITNDIAIALRTSIDVADTIKHQYGSVTLADTTKLTKKDSKDTIDLSPLMGEGEFVVPRKQLNRIVDARVNELFDLVGTELKKPNDHYLLPAGLVMAGGGANLANLPLFAKERLGLATRIGTVASMEGISQEVLDPSFAVACGLVLWGVEQSQLDSRSGSSIQWGGDLLKKISKLLKNFMP